jgi:hypothetical protein
MPIDDGKSQVFGHGFARDHFAGVVMFERQGVFGTRSFEFDVGDVFERWLHIFNFNRCQPWGASLADIGLNGLAEGCFVNYRAVVVERDLRKKRRQLPGAFVTHQYQPVYSVGPGLDNWKNPVAAGVPFCDPSTVGRQAVGIGAQVL